jgi:transposase
MPARNSAKPVFLDATWATTNMTRARGRAPRGQSLIGMVPHGHRQTTTFLCALRHNGLVASLVLDGAIDGPSFLAWVEQFLAPMLAPGGIVVADNLNSHKVADVREAIEKRGASLWLLPSYSRDPNPIELVSSKLKRLVRSTAARTVYALWHAIGQLLGQLDPAEYASYVRDCSYPQSVR